MNKTKEPVPPLPVRSNVGLGMKFPRYAKTEEERIMDREANIFAYAFLMPTETFKAKWAELNGNVWLVADYFKTTIFHTAQWAKYHGLDVHNDRVEGRDAALSRRVPSHDGLCGNGNYNERTDK